MSGARRRKRCTDCGELYAEDLPGKDNAGVCPDPICTAKRAWSPEQWEGRARMARARVAAGIATNTLDNLALERIPR